MFDVTWRKNGTSFVISETTIAIGISSKNMMRQLEISTRFPVPKLWLKRWFSWFSICLTLTIASSNVKMMTQWAIDSFRQHHWPWLQHVNVKGQGHSQFSPNASNEKCTMGRVLFMITYYYNSGKFVTLTFDMWPWPFCLTLTLMFDLEVDILLHWALKTKLSKKKVWRHVTQKWYLVRYIGDNNPDRYFLKEHDAPN